MSEPHCIIAGAGPAGLAAAITLHRAGVPVLVVEKNTEQHHKPCGGGLTPRARLVLDELGLKVFRGLEIRAVEGNSPPWHYNHFTSKRPMMSVAQRGVFNQTLLASAREAGVQVAFARINKIRLEAPGRFCVETNKGSFHSRTLVAADGAASLVRRTFGGRVHGLARTMMVDNITPGPYPGLVACDGCALPLGYGWIFPYQDNTANAGVYTISPMGGKELRRHLDSFLSARLGHGRAHSPVRGGVIPWGGYLLPKNAPVILTGDAGGFADPLTGEGIFHALFTGRTAAKAILAASPEQARQEYENRLRITLAHLRLLRYMAPRMYKYPRQGGLVFGLAPMRHLLCEGLMRGFSLPMILAAAPGLLLSAATGPLLSSYTHTGPMSLPEYAQGYRRALLLKQQADKLRDL